jgi:hypothetical protein
MDNNLEWLLQRGARRADALAVAGCGAALLLLAHGARLAAARRADAAEAALAAAAAQAEETGAVLAELEAVRDAKQGELDEFKRGLPQLAESRRKVYEGGLQLQEEKRLLEKQLELMTTYLLVEPAAGKVHLMRGEQALRSLPLGEGAPRQYGQTKAQPPLAAIVSKERFAHPERPKADQVGGQLQWEPPQVGESARANALGEFVVFTRGPLILHGPPRKAEEHAAFPHVCLELSLPAARRLYQDSSIGTKVMLKAAAEAKPELAKSPKR